MIFLINSSYETTPSEADDQTSDVQHSEVITQRQNLNIAVKLDSLVLVNLYSKSRAR